MREHRLPPKPTTVLNTAQHRFTLMLAIILSFYTFIVKRLASSFQL